MSKNLETWLAYLERQYTTGIDLGLDRIHKVAKKLNFTKFTCPVITVAGTNGKGSCIAYLETIALNAGLKVGAYASPHLVRFNERLRINGQEIDDKNLCDAFALVEVAGKETKLTYFEFTTLAILHILQHAELDLVLLEIGLGGRLDAVNIIDPDISVITTIAIDHVEYLGCDRETIGREKAGIMRENVPIVCGDPDPPKSILQRAKEVNAPFYGLGKQFDYKTTNSTWQWQTKGQRLTNLPLPKLPLQNAAMALMVLHLLGGHTCPPLHWEDFKTAILSAFLPGRFQRFDKPVEMILDVAHNPEAAIFLAENLKKNSCKGRSLAVVGMLKDKDIANTLKPMLSQIDAWYVTDLHGERGAEAQHLVGILQQLGQESCYTHETVVAAYEHAIKDCGGQDRIVIFGSFYTVGGILKHREL